MKLSVCTLILNEESKIDKCLSSIKNVADEIIVGIDELSCDKSEEIARKHTNNVFIVKHNDNFHIGKNKVIKKAGGDWIFWIDGDEYISKNLVKELETAMKNDSNNGYWVPRKNIIFKKWIEHTAWYPDYQLRLFKNGRGLYPCEKIHENQKVEGKIGYLKNNLIHQNYESVEQFIFKLNKYTSLDAENLNKKLNKLNVSDFLKRPMNEFIKRFLAEKGYLDGLHGLTMSILQSFYEFVVLVKVWEKRGFKERSVDINRLKPLLDSFVKDWKWWIAENKLKGNISKVRKIKIKVLRKLGF